MADSEFDLFVIGAGSAGVRAARLSAGFGARVAVAEAFRPGGTCVIRGCIPKKLLVYAAHYGEDFEDARAYGWNVDSTFSWPTLIANKNREIAQLEDFYRTLLKTSGVRLIEGRARIRDPNTVEVAGTSYSATNILIATGGWPTLPAIPGIEHCITSNEALELPDAATVAEALELARRAAGAAEIPWGAPTGIFGVLCDRNVVPRDGDRIELYRPLKADPKESRRERARAAKRAPDPAPSRLPPRSRS